MSDFDSKLIRSGKLIDVRDGECLDCTDAIRGEIKNKPRYTFITPTQYNDLVEAGYDIETEETSLRVVEPLISNDDGKEENNNVDEVGLGKDSEGVQEQDFEEVEVDIEGRDDWTKPVVHSDDDSDNATRKMRTTSTKVWDEVADLRNVEFGVYSRFKSAKVFRTVFKYYAAEKGFDYDFTKNDTKQVGMICKADNCNFYIWCSEMPDSTDLEIRTFYPDHTCDRVLDNNRITSDWLALRYLNYIRDNPKVDIPSFQNTVYRDMTVNVNEQRLYRAIRRAKTIIQGDTTVQYAKLYQYLAMITNTNPNSKWKLKVEHHAIVGEKKTTPRFQRLYIRFGPEKYGFLQGCRPLVGIDGCHLKGYFGGQLLTAVAWDANDGMFPLAFAIVEQENKESWKWFLQELFDDYDNNDQHSWVLISDKQKGLVELFRDWIPNIEHRYCMRHMYENWYKDFKSEILKKKLWECAKATSASKFEKKMEELKVLNNEAYLWLRARPAKEWCKAFFTNRAKSNIQTNSLSECFNSWISKERELPIISFCEMLRRKMMNRFYVKKNQIQAYKGLLCPNIYLLVEISKKESRNCFARPSGNGYYEVDEKGDLFIVKLNEKTCSCMDFQLNGIPCRHAMAAILKNKEKAETYVSQYYHVETMKKIYSGQIFPVLSEDDWPTVDKEPLQPPIIQKPPGRPRKRRIKNAAEGVGNGGTPYKASKKGMEITCSRCKEKGHNARSCTPKDYGESPAERKERLSRKANTRVEDIEDSESGEVKKSDNKIASGSTVRGGKGRRGGSVRGVSGGRGSSTKELSQVIQQKRVLARNRLEKRRKQQAPEDTTPYECSPEEIEQKRQAALERQKERNEEATPPVTEQSNQSEPASNWRLNMYLPKRQKMNIMRKELRKSGLPTQGKDDTNVQPPPIPSCGLAQAELNQLRDHEWQFTNIFEASNTKVQKTSTTSRFAKEARFIRSSSTYAAHEAKYVETGKAGISSTSSQPNSRETWPTLTLTHTSSQP